jgi:hypothetical protein
METTLLETRSCCDTTFALEVEWYEGRLLEHSEIVARFVATQREAIFAQAGGAASPACLLRETRRLIGARATLDLAAELRAQREAIAKEVWICGERGNYDTLEIELGWVDRHAPAWRKWRVRQYLFVVDRCADHILELLRRPAA